ncbi:pteridine reductase [Solemya velesiana gill symbiont]|uniref:Pteridine reductase n=1 Tax=Solemya velesiana gill symbiont TaxID=1918948 RepID=A0A1T2KWH8_9GAMM|nr:pteridine reductase [Solemya velesiana gill symbiont]
MKGKVALVTGAAHRIGATIARRLHGAGMDIGLHYRSSEAAAQALKEELEARRPESVKLIQADLHDTGSLPRVIAEIDAWRGRLDLLVNNASSFYPTPLESVEESHWDDLIGSNLKAPFFLAKAAASLLKASKGCVINLVDIHAERPLSGYPIYSMAKAGNAMMVKTLARELGPDVRVNGVAPGAILWPEEGLDDEAKETILSRTALKRPGNPEDIGGTVLFLAREANYITGQIIAVDGGRSVQH